mgnify:CR=1 FL=1
MTSTGIFDDVEVECTDTGSGRPIVVVHGAYVSGALRDDMARLLSRDYRCIVAIWPFGALRTPLGPAWTFGGAGGWLSNLEIP